ncbi:NADH-quinone oxidoreductase subunit C [Streptomyces sp. NBC_01551]|uniref:NADH-quinone oxidoreductase subunit C n=1 Tax=Streptomyces sp. NBC_01551 TaxID=2975876 RepID=UPI0022563438|nr:NADH-quinone oxidoreductase subunit C [Streptomyces sp. NBC_01551]MCX4527488.1 NADH-quinone oxidoreductase subunit C [Streptomyces sp. NBC_01551]
MNLYDTLPDAAATVFGAEAVGSSAYDVLTVDVPVGSWISSLEIARDKLGCTYFDWLSAVDEPGTGFRVCAHVVSLENHRVRRLLLRTTVPHAAPSLPSAVAVYAGAEWHERETFEMFGVVFTDHPHLVPLLLPENFEGHPLRKDFVLAARVAKAWPGAKEPGEAHDPDAPKRRQMLPPGVPDPNDWGPLKGQLPPAPTRPTRTPRTGTPTRTPREGAAATRTPREGAATPPRRTRSVADGSASQATPDAPADAPSAGTPESPARPPRRTRSVADGSASQATPPEPATGEPGSPARRTRSAGQAVPAPEAGTEPPTPDTHPVADGSADPAGTDGSAETPARPARRSRSAADGSASQAAAAPAGTDAPAETPPPVSGDAQSRPPGGAERRRPAPRSADAPWHNPKPAFEEPEPTAPPKPDTDPDTGGDA